MMGRELLDTAGRHGTRHTRFGRRIVIDQRQSSASAVEKDLSGQNRVCFCLFVNLLVAQTSFLSKHSMWLCARIWVKNPPQPKDGEGSLFFSLFSLCLELPQMQYLRDHVLYVCLLLQAPLRSSPTSMCRKDMLSRECHETGHFLVHCEEIVIVRSQCVTHDCQVVKIPKGQSDDN